MSRFSDTPYTSIQDRHLSGILTGLLHGGFYVLSPRLKLNISIFSCGIHLENQEVTK